MNTTEGMVKAIVSIVLGIIGTATMHLLIGIPISVIGMVLGYASYDYTDRRLSYAGLILNHIGIIWISIICTFGA